MKAIIITRAIDESPDSEKIRAFLNNTNIIKIAVNTANCKANIRLFVDCQHWKQYLNYPEQLMTRAEGLNLIPKEQQERFIFFNHTKTPCTKDNTELFIYPSSMGACIDLAYKLGVTDLLLIADNKIVEDGKAFFKGYCQQSKDVTDFYNTKMNIYQFSNGNFNLPVKSIKDFI